MNKFNSYNKVISIFYNKGNNDPFSSLLEMR